MNIVELFARIGLKTDEEKAKRFHKTMTVVKFGLFAATAAAAVASIAIKKISSDAMNAAVAFKQFEVETGSSAQELQKWQAVAEQTNQSAESVSSAIKAIVSNQEKIKLGQGDISGFQLLGIDPRQDPFKILEELRDKTEGVTQGMKKNLLAQLGIGAGLMQTLELSRKEFDAMADRAWIISPEAIKTLNKTKSAVDLAARAMGYMKAQIAVGLSPQIRKLTKDFQKFMKVNEKAIIGGFKSAFKYVTMFVKALYNAGSAFNSVVSATVGWKIVIAGLIGYFIKLNAVLLLSPIGLIAAGIILLIAVLDDLYTYSKGGKSLFGVLMKEFPDLEKTLLGSFRVIRDVFELLKSIISGDETGINKIIENWGAWGKAIKAVLKGLKSVDKFLKGEKFLDFAFGKPDEAGHRTQTEGFKRMFGNKPEMNKNGDINGGAVTQNINITQNINGTGDPNAVGDAAAKSIQRSINAASAQLPRDQ